MCRRAALVNALLKQKEALINLFAGGRRSASGVSPASGCHRWRWWCSPGATRSHHPSAGTAAQPVSPAARPNKGTPRRRCELLIRQGGRQPAKHTPRGENPTVNACASPLSKLHQAHSSEGTGGRRGDDKW